MELRNADGSRRRDERQRHPLPGPGAGSWATGRAWPVRHDVAIETDAGPAHGHACTSPGRRRDPRPVGGDGRRPRSRATAPEWTGGAVTPGAAGRHGQPPPGAGPVRGRRRRSRSTTVPATDDRPGGARRGGQRQGARRGQRAPAHRGRRAGHRHAQYERGVGLTQACGTGRLRLGRGRPRWGLVGDGCRWPCPAAGAEVTLGATDARAGGPAGPGHLRRRRSSWGRRRGADRTGVPGEDRPGRRHHPARARSRRPRTRSTSWRCWSTRPAPTRSAASPQRRDRPTRPPTWARARPRSCASWREATDCDTVVFDDELTPGPAVQPGEAAGAHRHRPHRGDPRHLRPERPQPGGQGPGRAGPAALPPAPAAAPGRRAVAAGGRHVGGGRRPHRHPGPGRDPARGRPAAHRAPHPQARGRPARHRAPPHHPAQGASAAASSPTSVIVGYTNAGKSTLLNRLTDAGVLVEDRLFATLDATTRRLSLPGGERGAGHRHGRVHPQAAPPAGGGVQVHARRGRRRRPAGPRGRRQRARRGRQHPRGARGAGRDRRRPGARAAGLQQGRPGARPRPRAWSRRTRVRWRSAPPPATGVERLLADDRRPAALADRRWSSWSSPSSGATCWPPPTGRARCWARRRARAACTSAGRFDDAAVGRFREFCRAREPDRCP